MLTHTPPEGWIWLSDFEAHYSWPTQTEIERTVLVTGGQPSFLRNVGRRLLVHPEKLFAHKRKKLEDYRRKPVT